MHVAVERGAQPNQPFAKYVDYLREQHLVPADSDDWLDEIRLLGNHAAHEIEILDVADAETAVDFTTQLLRNVYEVPARGKAAKERREQRRHG
ncbi:MAG: DUF4145 domain-containing protein [Patulibacter sp.]